MRSLYPALFLALLTAPALAADIAVPPGADAAEKLAEALISAKEGDTVWLGFGRYELTDGLSLDVHGVAIRGMGPDQSILSFTGQQGSGEGLLVTSSRVTLADFGVENPKGDGIKSKGSDEITFRNLRVEWTGGPKAENGAYGVYPVESKNVLIEGVTVRGASDAGIYVGQSAGHHRPQFAGGIQRRRHRDRELLPRRRAWQHRAAQYRRHSRVRPAGPAAAGRSRHRASSTMRSSDNDTREFRAQGQYVAMVPKGMGIMVMANRNVHVFGNRFVQQRHHACADRGLSGKIR